MVRFFVGAGTCTQSEGRWGVRQCVLYEAGRQAAHSKWGVGVRSEVVCGGVVGWVYGWVGNRCVAWGGITN